MNIPVLSAYISGSLFSRAHGKSFMYMRNNKGPRLEPCGIPDLTMVSGEFLLLTEQYCCLGSEPS